ncbi:hypothetical protein IEU95_12585 [Hoyosella rhizosphaerae]|nr:DUF6802 family protein [Hoyosella rhizosphaerae]MBN4927673.1 hypothetical protein [Hoyosella rhizosphaerae]
MWTPDELLGGGCLADLWDGAPADYCRAELANPGLDISGDGRLDSARLLVGESVILASDTNGDGFVDAITQIGVDNAFEAWRISELPASEHQRWQRGDDGLLA